VIGRLLLAGSGGTPDPVTRDGAAAAARAELSKNAYHQHEPSLVERGVLWLLKQLGHALDDVSSHAPGHGVGVLVLVAFVALVVVATFTRIGRPRRAFGIDHALFGVEELTAADHRRRAEGHAGQREWAEAIRERLRAISRELEERGVLDPRPGRTADELCAEASLRLPGVADEFARAAAVFDAVWYGGRPADPDDEARLHALDDRIAGPHRALRAQPSALSPV
jgi:hypothetical protein